jgi:hypothetical protein
VHQGGPAWGKACFGGFPQIDIEIFKACRLMPPTLKMGCGRKKLERDQLVNLSVPATFQRVWKHVTLTILPLPHPSMVPRTFLFIIFNAVYY